MLKNPILALGIIGRYWEMCTYLFHDEHCGVAPTSEVPNNAVQLSFGPVKFDVLFLKLVGEVVSRYRPALLQLRRFRSLVLEMVQLTLQLL